MTFLIVKHSSKPFFLSHSPCAGIKTKTRDSLNYGFQESVYLCVRHHEELRQKNRNVCCFLICSPDDKCSGRLAICPQRFVSVFEDLAGRGKLSGRNSCQTHLTQADNDTRITGNINYISPRKVSPLLCIIHLNFVLFFYKRAKVEDTQTVKVSPKDPPIWSELLKHIESLERENVNLKIKCKTEEERSKQLCIENSNLNDRIKDSEQKNKELEEKNAQQQKHIDEVKAKNNTLLERNGGGFFL
ncbi:uncharacterized protein LOC144648445 [Oculina patagonica]